MPVAARRAITGSDVMWRPRTLLITDRVRLREATGADDDAAMVAYVAAAAAAGVDAVQVRDRAADDRHLLRWVRQIVEALAGSGCRVLVNERATSRIDPPAWAARICRAISRPSPFRNCPLSAAAAEFPRCMST